MRNTLQLEEGFDGRLGFPDCALAKITFAACALAICDAADEVNEVATD